MATTITAVFDGEVLRPDESVDLKPHTRYRVTVSGEIPPAQAGNAWQVLDRLAGTVEAPADWAEEHDHYLCGTPERKQPTRR